MLKNREKSCILFLEGLLFGGSDRLSKNDNPFSIGIVAYSGIKSKWNILLKNREKSCILFLEGLLFGGWSLSLQGGDAMITYFELVQISIQFVLAGIQLGMLIVAIIALLKK